MVAVVELRIPEIPFILLVFRVEEYSVRVRSLIMDAVIVLVGSCGARGMFRLGRNLSTCCD